MTLSLAAVVSFALAAEPAAEVLPPPDVTAERAPSSDARAEAATASGLVSFVGLVVGGLGSAALVGFGAFLVGSPLATDALLWAGAVGGTLGAATGGAIGAFPTTTCWGPPLVGAAAGAGAVIGLVPAALFGRDALTPGGDDTSRVVHSVSIMFAMVATAGAAAGAGALLAAPDPPPPPPGFAK